MTDGFLPHLTFRIERSVVRTPHAVKAWLVADVARSGVQWTVLEETWVNKGMFRGHVQFEGPFLWEKHTNYLSYIREAETDEQRELVRRARAVNAPDLLAATRGAPTAEAANLVWIVFNALYYPAEREDVHNAWIRDSFPELHEEMMSSLRRKNMATLRDVYDS